MLDVVPANAGWHRASMLWGDRESMTISYMGTPQNLYAHIAPYCLWKTRGTRPKQEFLHYHNQLLFLLFKSTSEWPLSFDENLFYIFTNAEKEKELESQNRQQVEASWMAGVPPDSRLWRRCQLLNIFMKEVKRRKCIWQF